MPTSRQQALHDYFLAVTRDLLARGVIRRAQGQSLEDILNAESRMVLSEVWSDLKGVGEQMLGGMIFGLLSGSRR